MWKRYDQLAAHQKPYARALFSNQRMEDHAYEVGHEGTIICRRELTTEEKATRDSIQEDVRSGYVNEKG